MQLNELVMEPYNFIIDISFNQKELKQYFTVSVMTTLDAHL